MANDKTFFSEEYISDSSTKPFSDQEVELKQIDFKIDAGKYGISKPKRVTIKAKIIHGTN